MNVSRWSTSGHVSDSSPSIRSSAWLTLSLDCSRYRVCPSELGDRFRRTLEATQPDGVQVVDASPNPDGAPVRECVLRQFRVPTNKRPASDATELMDARVRAHDRLVLHNHMTCECGAISKDDVVPDDAVVSHMGIGHEHIIVTDQGEPSTAACPTMNGHALAKDVAVPR